MMSEQAVRQEPLFYGFDLNDRSQSARRPIWQNAAGPHTRET
jgi:hypothetical protein